MLHYSQLAFVHNSFKLILVNYFTNIDGQMMKRCPHFLYFRSDQTRYKEELK